MPENNELIIKPGVGLFDNRVTERDDDYVPPDFNSLHGSNPELEDFDGVAE